MGTNKIIKINAIIFLSYLAIYFLTEIAGTEVFSLLKILLGISVFLVTGLNAAMAVERELNLKLDFWETLLIGAVISLFFIPLALFLVYKIAGSVNEWINLPVYVAISALSLLFLKYKNNATGKI